jgi:hypothetical protein
MASSYGDLYASLAAHCLRCTPYDAGRDPSTRGVAFSIVAGLAAPVAGQPRRAEQVAAQALHDGDADKAAAAFAEALKDSPRDARLHYGAGVAARLRGRDDEARTFLRRALDLEPRLTPAAALFGELAYEHGDVDVAIRTYEAALAYAPLNDAIATRLTAWRDEAAKERRVDGLFSIAFDGRLKASGGARRGARDVVLVSGRRSAPIRRADRRRLLFAQQFRGDRGAGVGWRDVRHAHPPAGPRRAQTPDQFDTALTHGSRTLISSLAARRPGVAARRSPPSRAGRATLRRLRLARVYWPSNTAGGLTATQVRVARRARLPRACPRAPRRQHVAALVPRPRPDLPRRGRSRRATPPSTTSSRESPRRADHTDPPDPPVVSGFGRTVTVRLKADTTYAGHRFSGASWPSVDALRALRALR